MCTSAIASQRNCSSRHKNERQQTYCTFFRHPWLFIFNSSLLPTSRSHLWETSSEPVRRIDVSLVYSDNRSSFFFDVMADCICDPQVKNGHHVDAWIQDHFHDCVYNPVDMAAFVIGMSSLGFWICCQAPQFIKNWKNGSAEVRKRHEHVITLPVYIYIYTR